MNIPYELTKDLTIKLMYHKSSVIGIASDKQLVLQYQNFIAKMVRDLPEVSKYIASYTTSET